VKRKRKLDIYKENIPIDLNGKEVMVSLSWFRGASRWNNGATVYGRKYTLRLIIGRLKQKHSGDK
jgi:hypothetical protein